MAFSIYKVVYMACQSCSWFVYTATELGAQTNQLHINARSHARKKPLHISVKTFTDYSPQGKLIKAQGEELPYKRDKDAGHLT